MANKKLTKTCNQIVTPSVDNSDIECDELILETCVVLKKNYPLIKAYEGDTLQEFIIKLMRDIAIKNNQIKSLSNRIKALEDAV